MNPEADLQASGDPEQADMSSKAAATHHLVQALSITQADLGVKIAGLQDGQMRIEEAMLRVVSGQREIVDMLTQLLGREGGGS